MAELLATNINLEIQQITTWVIKIGLIIRILATT